jgi:hypothetical protein
MDVSMIECEHFEWRDWFGQKSKFSVVNAIVVENFWVIETGNLSDCEGIDW